MQKMQEVTKEQYSEWRDNPVTKLLFKQFEVEVELSRINLVHVRGTVQERGEQHLKITAVTEVFDLLYSMNLDYINTPIYMEED